MAVDALLHEFENRLTAHFSELHRRRCTESPGNPVFALEHGLNLTEVKALGNAVRAHIAAAPPSRDHALTWVVYSAEIGYRYAGDEYWQTFEEETPRWTVLGDRHWIRDQYRSFQQKYNGARPSGAWAEHFSIISWPITHAILPQDLQRQLARALYELRHSFSAELLESPSLLGEFIRARSWNATSRFRILAEQTHLVGLIASALLLEGASGAKSLIHPMTLRRIGQDLDRTRRAREWLRGARQFAQDRAQVKGLALSSSGGVPIWRRPEEARAEVAALGIEPRLVLRPEGGSGASWSVQLEIPDLSHLLVRFPATRDILADSRCVVAGSSSRPLARGRCLHGAQRVALARWPKPDEVLLSFERTDALLEYLLRTECLLRPGSTWLFRIASDGLAYELRGLRVRPGERYIVVSSRGSLEWKPPAQPLALACEGAHAVLLNLPAALTDEWLAVLLQLGLAQSKTIEVWPAGLASMVWDGEGRGEWLASERPCLAIRSDHPVNAICISLSSHAGDQLELAPVLPGTPMFVELPELPVGLHTVRVSTREDPEGADQPLGDLDVVIRIREARPWLPGVSSRGPLTVQLEPATPTLEQVWEGRIALAVLGPKGRRVKPTVSLFERGANPPTAVKHLPPLQLPVESDTWKAHFEKHFRASRQAQATYDLARSCELTFSAEELGTFTVRCEREFTPLRWAVSQERECRKVRLLDDSGGSALPRISLAAFEFPMVETPLSLESEYRVPDRGGLYIARLVEWNASVVVPPTIRGLADLGCTPQLAPGVRCADAAVQALVAAGLWGQARLPGDIVSSNYRRIVLHCLTRHIAELICGENWSRTETSIGSAPDGLAALQRAITRQPGEVELGMTLQRDIVSLAAGSQRDRIRALADVASRWLPIGRNPATAHAVAWFAEFALRIASDPGSVTAWAGDHLRVALARLLEEPTIVRAARFMVLATDRHLQSRSGLDQLYAGWTWS